MSYLFAAFQLELWFAVLYSLLWEASAGFILQHRAVLQLVSHLSIQSIRIWVRMVGHFHSKFHNVNKTFAKKNVKNQDQTTFALIKLIICDLPGRLLHLQGMFIDCLTSCLEDENCIYLSWAFLRLGKSSGLTGQEPQAVQAQKCSWGSSGPNSILFCLPSLFSSIFIASFVIFILQISKWSPKWHNKQHYVN